MVHLLSRAVSKRTYADVAVRSIENAQQNPHEINRWIRSIGELHRNKPPPQVRLFDPIKSQEASTYRFAPLILRFECVG